MEKFLKKIIAKAFYCGDYINTDVISPGRFEPYQGPNHLASIALIDYDSIPPFIDPNLKRSPYGIIFAGVEFGCGSSRETAPQALYYAGVRVIIAKSFARIFFRNCINMGLIYPIIYNHPFTQGIIGHTVSIDLKKQFFIVQNQEYHYQNLGDIEAIISAGGLINYTKRSLEI